MECPPNNGRKYPGSQLSNKSRKEPVPHPPIHPVPSRLTLPLPWPVSLNLQPSKSDQQQLVEDGCCWRVDRPSFWPEWPFERRLASPAASTEVCFDPQWARRLP